MKTVAGAIVILAGSVLSAAAVIAEAIPKVSNTIPPTSAGSAGFMGFAIILIGAVVMGIGLRAKSDQTQSARTD